ncbi:hypothetical protein J1614_004279 [Plenodomus biglobosus]|nr:hypothetical protein J1614_004279 [Plenodomus biglobosus]
MAVKKQQHRALKSYYEWDILLPSTLLLRPFLAGSLKKQLASWRLPTTASTDGKLAHPRGSMGALFVALPPALSSACSGTARVHRVLCPVAPGAHSTFAKQTMADAQPTLPSEAAISNALRNVVIDLHKAGNADDLTVKRVRARAEKQLGLDDGFFKTHPSWKQRSHEAIVEAVEKYCDAEPPPLPTPTKAAPKPKGKPKAKPAPDQSKATAQTARGVKRKAAAATKAAKRRKPSSDQESEADDDSDSEPVAPGKRAKPKAPDSDSDLSSVIDEEPVKKQRKKKGSAPAANKASKPKTAHDPDEAKIKELQGWLVKCGVRKVWSRDAELSKCNTAKEKIHVLHNMLKDVGMEGKFSVEKAAKIKEQREFAKDLEAIKEGEMAWGKTAEVTSTGRPSRRAAARPAPVQKVVLEDDSEEDMEEGGADDDESSDEDEDEDDLAKPDSDHDSEAEDDGSGADDSD